MQKANLRNTGLNKAVMDEANLRGVDFSGADLREADLRGADLFQAVWTDGRVCSLDSLGICR